MNELTPSNNESYDQYLPEEAKEYYEKLERMESTILDINSRAIEMLEMRFSDEEAATAMAEIFRTDAIDKLRDIPSQKRYLIRMSGEGVFTPQISFGPISTDEVQGAAMYINPEIPYRALDIFEYRDVYLQAINCHTIRMPADENHDEYYRVGAQIVAQSAQQTTVPLRLVGNEAMVATITLNPTIRANLDHSSSFELPELTLLRQRHASLGRLALAYSQKDAVKLFMNIEDELQKTDPDSYRSLPDEILAPLRQLALEEAGDKDALADAVLEYLGHNRCVQIKGQEVIAGDKQAQLSDIQEYGVVSSVIRGNPYDESADITLVISTVGDDGKESLRYVPLSHVADLSY